MKKELKNHQKDIQFLKPYMTNIKPKGYYQKIFQSKHLEK